MDPRLVALLEKGHSRQLAGDLAAAEKLYLKVLRHSPRNEFALNLMGVVAIRKSDFKNAASYLKQALRVNPNDPETHSNLGLAYKELTRFPEARQSFENALKLDRNRAKDWNNLGNVLAATDQHTEAIRCFESALAMDNTYVDCLNNLSVSLKEVGRLEHALQVIEQAIRTAPGHSLSHNNKGEILLRATQYERAREAFERSIGLDQSIVARINLSTALKQLGDDQAAVQTLKAVLAEEANNSEAWNHLGVLYEQLGDTDEAARSFRLAIRHTPNHASSYYQLSKLKNQHLAEDEIKRIHELLEDPDLLEIFRSSLYFALACEHEKRGEFDTSFGYLLKGQKLKGKRHPYDGATVEKYNQAVTAVFPIKRGSVIDNGDELPIPVFVVGMPRSGTTLTEQILSSHSKVTGAGEVGFISDLVRQASEMTGQPHPKSIENLTPGQLAQLRKTYLHRMQQRFGNNQYMVDKNPLNFNLLGVIATVFPEAKIFHCIRNPMDNCVSIFRLPFDDNQGYSHDLVSLGHYYRQHEKLMALWKTCYPGRIMDIHYEDTVADLGRQARLMLDFIGADFEEQVLRFFDNERIVMTPSAEQVRQPIYTDRIQAWKKFANHLEPLATSLGLDKLPG